jgi:hypothetical protein
MKRKRPIWYTYLFCIFMIFIALFSKSIYYYCMPKVELTKLQAISFLTSIEDLDGNHVFINSKRRAIPSVSLFGEFQMSDDNGIDSAININHLDDKSLYVWVAVDQSGYILLEKRKVKVGVTDGIFSEITEGLSDDDQIVIAWDRPIIEGAKVVEVLK